MEKRYGATASQNGLFTIGRNKWALFYGFGKDNPEAESGYNYYHVFTGRKPSWDEVKALIVSQINANTDAKILSGFVWKDMPVWLSFENQFNYKVDYDRAVQSGGKSLPVTFKFGTDDEVIYHSFESLNEITDFYESATAFVKEALADGWAEKDSLKEEDFL